MSNHEKRTIQNRSSNETRNLHQNGHGVQQASSDCAATDQLLAETMFKDAIKLEKLLVGYREMHWKPLGPLHGFPISQKDTSNYADLPSTLGIVSYLDNPVPS